MAKKLQIDTRIDRAAKAAIQNTLGDSIRKSVTMFLGNPSADNPLYFDDEKTMVWIVDNPEQPNEITSMPKAGIPSEKLIEGTAVLVKKTINGYRFVSIDHDYDAQFSEDDATRPDQKPVLVSQISYGTIRPYSGMSVQIAAAFYGNDFVADLITGDIDDQIDTSAAAINIPGINNRAIGILIQLDAPNATLSYKQSEQYSAFVSLQQAYQNGLLDEPDIGKFRIGYIQLYNGQTEIRPDDILQAPEWIRPAIESFTVSGDSGTPQVITDGNTLNIAGGTAIEIVASATDVLTVNHSNSAVTPGSYANADITVDAQGHVTAAAAGTPDGISIPDDLDPYGSPPDESVVFGAQSIGTSDFWQFTGDEMRRWLASAPAVDLSGVDSRALQAWAFNSATDRTISIASGTPQVGQQMRIHAVQVSGGTGHKVLLPAGVYFGETGTNRAALFDTVGDRLDALCFDIGGTLRFLYFESGVTFASS